MPWKLEKKPRFKKDISKIPQGEQNRIDAGIRGLINNPSQADIVKLNDQLWRLRVGDWRVFLDMDNKTGTITALYLERRTSKTY